MNKEQYEEYQNLLREKHQETDWSDMKSIWEYKKYRRKLKNAMEEGDINDGVE